MAQKTKRYYPAEHIELVKSGSDYFDRIIDLIGRAQQVIHIQMYIFADDDIGKKVIAVLLDAVKRGVKVNILVDGYGSAELKKNSAKQLRRQGINLRFFSPVYFNAGLRMGRRLHHKIVLIDDIEALVGGINISVDYYGTKDTSAWLDYGVHVKGHVCSHLTRICAEMLNNRITQGKQLPHVKDEAGTHIKFSQSDYIRGRRQITVTYRRAIRNAHKEITIINAYFLPGIRLKRLLQSAARRGVKIRVILSGKSDVLFMKQAMNYYYAWLIRNNIEIYEYQPTIIHAKAAVFDNSFTTVGSFNLNMLSEYISIELNADILDDKFSTSFNYMLNEMIAKDCIKVAPTVVEHKNIFSRLFDTISYYALSASQSVLFFLTRKDKMNELG